MQKLSLISSLYRSEAHLANFIERVQAVLAASPIPLEIVLVANDATNAEGAMLDDFAQHEAVRLLYCPRETVYASWNRGIAAATGDFLGFWNVDDERSMAGLAEGYRLLSAEAEIVDFAYEIAEAGKIKPASANYRPASLMPRDTVGPFFLFRRNLFERAGPFNAHFTIVGDYDWAARDIVRTANYQASEIVAGRFILHEGNLSGGRQALEWVEFNMALLRLGVYAPLRPVDPTLMRQVWEAWGKDYATMPPELAEWFWGAGAEVRFKNYQAYQQSQWAKRLTIVLNRLKLAPKDPFAAPKTSKV